ncbi:hypothetical protein SKAU_G00061500 [Synaphobranchus kaupii]|uniref:Uncharacterized protein n=1 Tax=Synaphobranchus kaupii TaxID=118154 RepID=A0A9Q1JAS6_SYNKA|nr:hypothetical protein SKAU_G00061500 [Synaphobranchus kaupii]
MPVAMPGDAPVNIERDAVAVACWNLLRRSDRVACWTLDIVIEATRWRWECITVAERPGAVDAVTEEAEACCGAADSEDAGL